MGRVTLPVLFLLLAPACKKHLPASMPEVALPATPPVTRPPPVEEAPTAAAAQLTRAYFALDSSNLSADAKRVLADDAKLLAANPTARVEIQGHCDERGTTEYNMALGQRRAQATRVYLASQGIAPSRLNTVSYGEERPAAVGSDESAWTQNRRAELRLLSEVPDLSGTVR